MFRIQKGGDYRQTHNHNDAPATIKLFGFLFIVGLVGGIAWAVTRAVQSVTAAMGRTWTPGNNDHLISGWNTLTVVGGLTAILLITLAILPYLVRNWQQAVNPPRPQRDDWQVLPQPGQPMLETEPQPFGLLVDGQHEESFIDAESTPVAERVGQWL